MRVEPVEPARVFEVGKRGGRLAHVADVALGADEQLTFVTDSGTEWDAVRKSWGYYATPSVNGRLREHGLRAVLTSGVPRDGEQPARMYLMLVEAGREEDFHAYLSAEHMRVVAWLDSDEAVATVTQRLGDPPAAGRVDGR